MLSLAVNKYTNEKAAIVPMSIMLLLAYPLFMDLFVHNLTALTTEIGLLSILGSSLGVLLVFFPSLMGIKQLSGDTWQPSAHVKQRVFLHLLVCTPVIYTFFTLVSYISGVQEYRILLWLGINLLLSLLVVNCNLGSLKPYPAWFRVAHGILAATFILGFFALHWFNHLAALWSTSAHGAVQENMRIWYRSAWVEGTLLIICVLLICSGFYMALQQIKRGGDRFKRLQTASGSYLGLFFCTHLTAIIHARNIGIDTNWGYATGEKGLIFSFQFLIPYYALALIYFTLHCALATRQILKAHGHNQYRTQWIYQITKATGLILTFLVMLAALGFSLNP